MSPGPQSPRDWDKELAKIDKAIAASGGDAPPSAAPAPRRTDAQVGARHRFFTWVRLALGLAAGIAMTEWPYTHGCDLPLFFYLGGVAAVVAMAVASTASSWKTRSGLAHFLSIFLLLWGLMLAAREVLPRVGYAKQPATWLCAAPPRPATPTP